MLIPKNNANQMRTRILIKIAESYFADKFKNADRIPLELRPKEQQPSDGADSGADTPVPLLHLQGPRGLKIPLHVQPRLFAGRRNR